MSSIDFGNPQVLANFVKSQIKEGKGEFIEKKDVTVFVSENGMQHVVTDDIKVEKEKKVEVAEEVKEEPAEEVKEEVKEEASEEGDELTCDICGKVAKSKLGLSAHMRSHK